MTSSYWNIYRSTDPAGPFVKVGTAPRAARKYVDTDVVRGVVYYYQIREVRYFVEGAPSVVFSGRLPTIADQSATIRETEAVFSATATLGAARVGQQSSTITETETVSGATAHVVLPTTATQSATITETETVQAATAKTVIVTTATQSSTISETETVQPATASVGAVRVATQSATISETETVHPATASTLVPITYTYYRLHITANGGGDRIGVRELELYESVGGANVATGLSPVASASASFSTYTPDKAFNGSFASLDGWQVDTVPPQWLQVQLSTAITVAQYGVGGYVADNQPTRCARDFTLQGSNDGTTWTTLNTQTGIDWTGHTWTTPKKFTI